VWLPFDTPTDTERLQALGAQLIAARRQPGWKIEARASHAATRLPFARHTHTGRFGTLVLSKGSSVSMLAQQARWPRCAVSTRRTPATTSLNHRQHPNQLPERSPAGRTVQVSRSTPTIRPTISQRCSIAMAQSQRDGADCITAPFIRTSTPA
jgi:hypothetical protein